MSSEQESGNKTNSSHPRRPVSGQLTSRSSFVYPIRSLLSGRIQPAGDSSDTDESRYHGMGNVGDVTDEARRPRRNSLGSRKDPSSQSHLQRSLTAHVKSSPSDGLQKRRIEVPRAADYEQEHTEHDISSLPPHLNFRHFPAENISCSSPRFSGSSPPISSPGGFVAGPVGEPIPLSPSSSSSGSETNVRHPVQMSEAAADAFSAVSSDFLMPVPHVESLRQTPLNPSEIGIVHLPPLPTPFPAKDDMPRSESAIDSWIMSQSEPSNLQQTQEPPNSVSPNPEHKSQSEDSLCTDDPPPAVSLTQEYGPWSCSQDQLVTFRYEHVEDEDGHHVLTGREGKLTRCEDEPIRTPGAVQGFGVLVAVDEDQESGTLLVRQVSENSTEILGLSPKFLFSLECFTDTLPEVQGDILWDNIQFLHEPKSNVEEQEDSPHVFLLTGWREPEEDTTRERQPWTCWCAVHRPMSSPGASGAKSDSNLIILEFELEKDILNALYPSPHASRSETLSLSRSTPGSDSTGGSDGTLVSTEYEAEITPSTSEATAISVRGESIAQDSHLDHSTASNDEDGRPTAEDILESTTNHAKPVPALERLRRMARSASSNSVAVSIPATGNESRSRRHVPRRRTGTSAVGMMDIFAVMAQINEQLGAAQDLDSCLKVVVGVIKDLTQFHRVLVYQFDEVWNGQVTAELVDWSQTHDLYKGLHFPASDIPAQARDLYAINTVRMLYNRSQPTARIVVRNAADLEFPLNMTHCYLRAMSPIHIKYLENMDVRASMSVSIMAFGVLWGLVSCHSYGAHGMRVSFPVRQMLRLLSQSISRNIERLTYARRLHTRKLINTMATDSHPTGYIVSNADDLLSLFDADYGILVIGEGAKILGPNLHGQEILVMAEYLRLKKFNTIQVSQAVVKDFPDLQLSTGLEVIAGLLYVPLSAGGKDFIAMLRKGQPRDVRWAGRPSGMTKSLEPRKSFKTWSETVAGRCRAWTDEQLETAGVLALVYGKFIAVWRQKESALQTTNLTNILLSNASHEVRTPLNHIINYLEMALNGPLDLETRDNLSRSHAASKNLLFTINDLLDLTRLESGHETSFNEPFDLQAAIEEASRIYSHEAARRNIEFRLEAEGGPKQVVGDAKKIKTVVANLTANALKYTSEGSITVHYHTYNEHEGLRGAAQTGVEIVVADTGCGIANEKLESIFREFEQVESSEPRIPGTPGVGLGLAVVARIVEQLGGQLRVDSKVDVGSRFSFLIPLELAKSSYSGNSGSSSGRSRSVKSLPKSSQPDSIRSKAEEINILVEALSSGHMAPGWNNQSSLDITDIVKRSPQNIASNLKMETMVDVSGPNTLSDFEVSKSPVSPEAASPLSDFVGRANSNISTQLRILIVEDNDVNRKILGKRLSMDGHVIVNSTNGQEGLQVVETDRDFDCILMDIQMPILNGFEATERIRQLEGAATPDPSPTFAYRLSNQLNGRVPIFAVSASLREQQRSELIGYGMDGWILKPIDFKRLKIILQGIIDSSQRDRDVYKPGCSWEAGGWFTKSHKKNRGVMDKQVQHY